MTPAAPLLIFDSGVGGLSVLAPTRALLPNAPIVYAADNALSLMGHGARPRSRRGFPRCSAAWSSGTVRGSR